MARTVWHGNRSAENLRSTIVQAYNLNHFFELKNLQKKKSELHIRVYSMRKNLKKKTSDNNINKKISKKRSNCNTEKLF